MLDPRIYRTALIPVALAVIVLAFSLTGQPGPMGTTLAPDAFNAQNATSTLAALAGRYPQRRPGSSGDQALAAYVSKHLAGLGYSVATDLYTARTVDGKRTLQNITATRTGSQNGQIAIVAARDAVESPDAAGLTGTAVLLELARVLSERTLNRSVVFASISGSAGDGGTARLAAQLGRPLDVVIVLGDLGGPRGSGPAVVPWSGTPDGALAPPALRQTVSSALAQDAGIRAGGAGLAGQLARLAFPLTLSAQAPFAAAGNASVLISSGGERGPAQGAPVSAQRLVGMGRAVLRTVTALQQGPNLPAPTTYVIYDRKVIPLWSVRLLVLALLLAPLAVAVDGLARARRRGHHISGWIVWVLAGGVPFALTCAVARVLGLAGVMPAAPPGPVGAGAVRLGAAGIAVMVGLLAVLGLAFYRVRPALGRMALVDAERDLAEGGAAVAVLLVLGACAVAIWVVNPFAAALAVPALHLWTWAVAPDLRLRLPIGLLLLLAGLAPVALEAVYYAHSFGLGPLAIAWSGTMLLGGGGLGIAWTAGWCVMAGCAVSAGAIAIRSSLRGRAIEHVPVTVRGPVTYAGPGSLGGTESALRARR
jgi:hypothetical protein